METTKRSNILIIISSIFLFLLLASNGFTIYLLVNTKDSLNNKNQALAVNKGKIEILQKENADLKGKHDDQVDAMSQALNRFIYHNAEIPRESDPDNPTPAEKHAKMVRQVTGGANNRNLAKALTSGW